MITYRKVTTSRNQRQVQDMAASALKSKLYVSGWALSQELDNIKHNRYNKEVAMVMAYDNDKPIAVCLVTQFGGYSFVMVFVRKKYRRQGIGTKLVKKVANNRKFRASYGIEGSDAFYKRLSSCEFEY